MTIEPVLEMTEYERKWLRTVNNYPTETDRIALVDELIAILLRVEAGRRKAEMYNRLYRLGKHYDKKLERTDADWLAEVEREVKG